jgi:hypothetical protein
MTDVAAEPQPYIMVDPEITLDGEDIHCLASHVELAPDVNVVETPTFCGVKEFPGSVKWYFRVTLYQSFDDNGTDQILRAARTKAIVPFTVLPFSGVAVSVNNPQFSGQVITKPYTLLSGDAGAASTIELEWTMTAEPEVSTGTAPSNGA